MEFVFGYITGLIFGIGFILWLQFGGKVDGQKKPKPEAKRPEKYNIISDDLGVKKPLPPKNAKRPNPPPSLASSLRPDVEILKEGQENKYKSSKPTAD